MTSSGQTCRGHGGRSRALFPILQVAKSKPVTKVLICTGVEAKERFAITLNSTRCVNLVDFAAFSVQVLHHAPQLGQKPWEQHL